METKGINIVAELRKEAASDKISRDVFKVMSKRERARNVITLGGLEQRMKKQGFNYEKADYSKTLRFLASLGLGKLVTDSSGRVSMLSDIKVSLQSIGAAAIGERNDLDAWKPRNKYEPIDQIASQPAPVVDYTRHSPFEVKPQIAPPVTQVSLTIIIKGKPLTFPIPNDLSADEIADLIIRFRGGDPSD